MKFLCWMFIVVLCAANAPSFCALPKVNTPAQDANGLNTKTDLHGETNRSIYGSKKEVTVFIRAQKGKASPSGDNGRRPDKNSASALVKNPHLLMLSTTVFSGSFGLALAFLL